MSYKDEYADAAMPSIVYMLLPVFEDLLRMTLLPVTTAGANLFIAQVKEVYRKEPKNEEAIADLKSFLVNGTLSETLAVPKAPVVPPLGLLDTETITQDDYVYYIESFFLNERLGLLATYFMEIDCILSPSVREECATSFKRSAVATLTMISELKTLNEVLRNVQEMDFLENVYFGMVTTEEFDTSLAHPDKAVQAAKHLGRFVAFHHAASVQAGKLTTNIYDRLIANDRYLADEPMEEYQELAGNSLTERLLAELSKPTEFEHQFKKLQGEGSKAILSLTTQFYSDVLAFVSYASNENLSKALLFGTADLHRVAVGASGTDTIGRLARNFTTAVALYGAAITLTTHT